MSTTNTQKKDFFDPTIPPPTPFIFPRPRRVIVGTEEHKVRVTSVLLPDSPSTTSSPPNNEVYIPRLNGARKLYVEQSEPAWMTGAHGQPNPIKINLPEADWRSQHPALRAQNLSRNVLPKKPEPALTTINMDPGAFEQDSEDLKYPPLITLRDLYKSQDDINWPKAMVKGDAPQIIGPSALREPAVVRTASANCSEKLSAINKCVCASGGCCPAQGSSGSSGSEKDKDQKSFVFPIRADNKLRPPKHTSAMRNRHPVSVTYDEAISTTYAILNGDIRGRSPSYSFADCSWMGSPEVLDQPTPSVTVPESVSDPPSKEKGSRMKIFGKGIFALFNGWRKKLKTINLEESNASVIPTNRHYESCILCTPQPSPHSSVSDSQAEFYAPSRQNPGPPPLTPPPSPGGFGVARGSGGLKQNHSRNTALFPVSFNQLEDIEQFQGGFGEPGPSNLSIEDLSVIPQWPLQEDNGPYNPSTESSLDLYSDLSSSLNWPLGNETNITSSDSGFLKQNLECYLDLSSSGSIELLTGTKTNGSGCGRRSYPSRNNNEASSSWNSGNDEIVQNRRASIFNRGISTPDLECGIKRLPLSNSPIFPGNQGITRLPDEVVPHPGVRKDHQVIGADGVYEMVDLGAVEPTNSELVTIEDRWDTRSVWRYLKETVAKTAAVFASVSLMKIEMRRFWNWCFVRKGAEI